MHRRENQGSKMKETFEAIREVVLKRNDVQVVYPVHLSPKVQEAAHEVFDDVKDVHLIDPLDVVDFHNLQAKAVLSCPIRAEFKKKLQHCINRF